MSWTEKIVNAKDEQAAEEMLQEAMEQIGSDMNAFLHQYEETDATLLLTVLQATIPQLEQIAGPSGVAVSRELRKMLACVRIVDPRK